MTLLDVNAIPGSSKRTDTQLLIILFTMQNIDCILINKQVPVLQEKIALLRIAIKLYSHMITNWPQEKTFITLETAY